MGSRPDRSRKCTRVELDVRQVLARVPGQRGVGIQVHDPVLELEVSQPDVDRQSLGELLTMFEIWAEGRANAVPRAHCDRGLIALRRDDHPVIKERLVNPDGLLQEVVIIQANAYSFDFHLKPTRSRRTRHFSRCPLLTITE